MNVRMELTTVIKCASILKEVMSAVATLAILLLKMVPLVKVLS